MRKFYLRTLVNLACIGLPLCGHAQETVTAITPLKVTSGFNADVIAEKKAEKDQNKKDGEQNKSTYAERVDANTNGGRSAFFTTAIQEEGAIKYKDGYLDGNTDYNENGDLHIRYKLNDPNDKNALLLRTEDNKTTGTLMLEPAEGGNMPAASTIYLLATSTEGSTTIEIKVYSKNNTVLGTETTTIGDWWAKNGSEKLKQVYETWRITTSGTWSDRPSKETHVNYVNKGNNNAGVFYLQRIGVSTFSSESVSKITITRIGGSSTTSTAVILAATAVTEEVTLKDSETSLDYLKNTTTNARIAETVKAKVNFEREFKTDQWNALVFPCPLTASEVKTMFGKDVKLSVAKDNSFVGHTVVFYPVDLTSDNGWAIEPGKYYLIKGVDAAQSHSLEYMRYMNPRQQATWENTMGNTSLWYFTGDTPEFTTSPNFEGETVRFHGTYIAGKQIDKDGYGLSGGRFLHYTDQPTIKGFRFWFTVHDSAGRAKKLGSSITLDVQDGGTTGITTAETETNAPTANIYSIDGRIVRQSSTSLDGLAKGIYIVNNKKVIVK